MRHAAPVEVEMQRDTIKYLRRNYIFMMTDPMPTFEADGRTKVHAIRYSREGMPNRFGL